MSQKVSRSPGDADPARDFGRPALRRRAAHPAGVTDEPASLDHHGWRAPPSQVTKDVGCVDRERQAADNDHGEHPAVQRGFTDRVEPGQEPRDHHHPVDMPDPQQPHEPDAGEERHLEHRTQAECPEHTQASRRGRNTTAPMLVRNSTTTQSGQGIGMRITCMKRIAVIMARADECAGLEAPGVRPPAPRAALRPPLRPAPPRHGR